MEALLYDKLENQVVQCRACNHFCEIKPGRRGICQVRENRQGSLRSLVYGRIIAQNVDPIEKKPIYHVKPGSLSFSIATVGCNLKCRFCQNSDIAQVMSKPAHYGPDGQVMGRNVSPQDVVDRAVAAGCLSISYTYTEPTVFFEFALDTAKLAKASGLLNIFVTNGFMSEDLINLVAPYLDAANVDLKAFDDEFYKDYCKAGVEPVKNNLIQMKKAGILVEVTTLLIPGLNDDSGSLEKLAGFIAKQLGCETPWHISRFHPCFKLTDRSPTPLSSLERAWEIGKKAGLHYVYMGNVTGTDAENTRCRQCLTQVIQRQGYITKNKMSDKGRCPNCGTEVYGIF